MITDLHLKNIGPTKDLQASFGERLNLVTGDNGLGKTFLLDACWYALTRTWAGDHPFQPTPTTSAQQRPQMSIDYSVKGKRNRVDRSVQFDYRKWDWVSKQGRPPMPGLVIYCRIDGGFSVWDPARNYWRKDDDPERLPAFHFTKKEVWDGRQDSDKSEVLSNGLVRDLETWRLQSNGPFHYLNEILRELSPSETEVLSIGDPVRISPKDARDIPTLRLPYGDVPVTQAASGMRRILSLAYLLVWAWTEHIKVSQQTGEPPVNRIVLLIDEIEAHLHPRWQQVVLPSVFRAISEMVLQGTASYGQMNLKDLKINLDSIQVIATTHSPLIPGSVESFWESEKDALMDFDISSDGEVGFQQRPFARHGSVEHWLTSDLFDLKSGYSRDAEQAINTALDLMRMYEFGSEAPEHKKDDVQRQLLATLGNDDEFWPRWTPWYADEMRAR